MTFLGNVCCFYCLLGNFYRIRSALKYGAHKLGQILVRPRCEVGDEIRKFFSNTRARHEHQHRSVPRTLALEFSDEESLTASLSSPIDLLSDDDDMLAKSSISDFEDERISAEHSRKEVSPGMTSEDCDSRNSKPDYALCYSNGGSLPENHFHKLHYLASRSSAESRVSEGFGFNPWFKNREEHVRMDNTFQWCMDNHEAACSCITGSNSTSKASVIETPSLDFRELDSASVGGESEAFNPLADLTGDYDSNIRSLLRAQLCHGFTLSAASAKNPSSPSPASDIQKRPWEVVHKSTLLEEKEFPKIDLHFMPTDHVMYASFEGTDKSRGLGTYFPDMV